LCVGHDEYIDGSFVSNNPGLFALKEASYLWDNYSIDYLISVGTGFGSWTKVSKSDESDGKIVWEERVVDLIAQTIDTDKKLTEECKTKNIFYARLNPEINFTFHFDSTSSKDLETLYHYTTEYLAKANNLIKSVCRRLVSSLLYVAAIKQSKKNNNQITVVIMSRVVPFNVSNDLGGPSWQLYCDVLSGKATTKVVLYPNNTQNPVAHIIVNSLLCTLSILLKINGETFPISGGNNLQLPSR
jgi:hypothetical protein